MRLSREIRELQNHKAFPCYLASLEYEKKLPKKLLDFSGLLARIKVKALEEGELGPACKLIAHLASREFKNSGFDWKARKVSVNFLEKSNTYYIVGFTTSCPKSKQKEIIRENEKMFSEKYGVEIKFILNGNLPNKASSFFIPKPP